MGEKAFNDWLKSELGKLLNNSSTAEDMMLYISSIDNKEELLNFIKELFGCGNDEDLDGPQREFIRELVSKWDRLRVPENVTVYRKNKESPKNLNKKLPKNTTPVTNRLAFDMSEIARNMPSNNSQMIDNETQEKKAKKKTSYVSLYGKDGNMMTNAVILPGRHSCECQAQKHKLVSNCLSCGRVVCEQEGSGPCMFCGNLVCSREEKEILARNSHKSEKLHKKLMSVEGGNSLNKNLLENNKALEKAKAYKERLLNYDRTCVQRTKVIDDESDYFATDSNWLSKKQKLALKKKQEEQWEQRHGSRLNNKKYTLDFTGRRVIEADVEEPDPTEDADVMAANFGDRFYEMDNETKSYSAENHTFPDLVNPSVNDYIPTFISNTVEASQKESLSNAWQSKENRLQDQQLREMSDPGLCLSMHQPWASLLVCGIKKDEGRTWYSEHRGRLWIAATSQTPETEDIKMIEQQSSHYWNSIQTKIPASFPKEYPTSCVLGCVDVKEVLSQEEYRDKYPNGESGSPFVFVCEKPKELTLKFPVKGKHKIWKLDSNTHKAAMRGLVL